jgi:formylglycine-generating enzyme required for sulfatase activity
MVDIAENIWAQRARAVANAKNRTGFLDLVKMSGLDKALDFRFADWSGVNFSNCDLDGFDFTGARLHGCNFRGARISGARFDQAEIGAILHDGKARPRDPARETKFANLRDAIDWDSCFDPNNWRKAKQPLSAGHLPVGAVFQDAPFAPELIVVPSGRFLMGSPDGSGGAQGHEPEAGRTAAEGPRQTVIFDRPFAIGRFAISFPEFQAFEARRDKGLSLGGMKHSNEEHPAVDVTYYEAASYCDWLNEILGLPADTYRLPSEAEWEFTARAGTDGPFWWQGPIPRDKANYAIQPHAGNSVAQKMGATSVRSFAPNPWGLYQVLGNVWEWCEDVYVDTLAGIPSNGKARRPVLLYEGTFAGYQRIEHRYVIRGGSCRTEDISSLRIAFRMGKLSRTRDFTIGFRVARTLFV